MSPSGPWVNRLARPQLRVAGAGSQDASESTGKAEVSELDTQGRSRHYSSNHLVMVLVMGKLGCT